ncbi:hypothetical protein AA313_de0203791 [Arthrobotrys entomopaga]|nr:hypothetical protein AA313_de0203791 [Arthrobotrys entomopaga]
MKQFTAKVSCVGPAAEIASDLQNVIKNQIYHQILRAIQSARIKKKYCFESSSDAENELLSQPLEKFQDLFERTGSLIFSQESKTRCADESSEFEDLFDEEDNYSDFEDLLQETKAINIDESSDEMTPDTPSAPSPSVTAPVLDSQNFWASQILQCDDDMVSEFSDLDFTMFDENLANSNEGHGTRPATDDNDEEYDDCLIRTTTDSSEPPLHSSAEDIAPVDEQQNCAVFRPNEETTQMLF